MNATELEEAQRNMRERYRSNPKGPKPADAGFGCRHTGGAGPCPRNSKGDCKSWAKLLHFEREYGLTRGEFLDMLAEQGKKCALCGAPFIRFIGTSKRRAGFVPDHCHKTGKVRALLCHNCNVRIGLFGDDPERLEKAAAYLRKHSIIS